MRNAELNLCQKLAPSINKLFALTGLLLCFAFTTENTSAQVALPNGGIVSTLVGNGTAGYTGDSGQATSAQVSGPWGVAVDSQGNIYLSDTANNVIRKITASTGIISTVAGNGTGGYSGDGGAATSAELNAPAGLAVDAAGNIYIADQLNGLIRKVTASTGLISTVAGATSNPWGGYAGDGGLATDAYMSDPAGVSLDSAGNIYIADMFNNAIRKVTASTGIITTVAGNGTGGYSGDGGAATSATLSLPTDVQIDSAGNLYIADYYNQVVREVSASTGVITTIAGTGTQGYSGDGGPAISATLGNPINLAVDPTGNIYISDSGNNLIRKVTASTGIISTVAGNYSAGYSGDGGMATAAALNSPTGLAVVPSTNFYQGVNLYFADSANNVLRVVGAYRTAAPRFSPISATYSTAQTVTISESIAGAPIYYTTDGSIPTTASRVYSGPITVTSSETINAVSVASNGLLTGVGTAPYTITQVAPTVDFSSGITTNGLNLVNAIIVGGALQLSDGNTVEQRAAWLTTPLSTQAFTSDFNYLATSPVADGITFVLQNSSDGVNALGGDGELLGYGGIGSSVGIKFDFYNNLGEGVDSTGVYTNGAAPNVPALDMTASGLRLRSGDLMHVHISYDGTNLTWTISDTVTFASYTGSTAINIPATVGGNTAYVGITGSTGTFTSTQLVSGWHHISGPATTFAATPVISPASGSYSTPQTVTIADATAGATIYYTTNGSAPTTASPIYTGPFTVSNTETVNAIAAATGYYNSAIASSTYTIASAVTVTVVPASTTLTPGQTQQFFANVSNTSNTAVTWTISPAGVGSVSAAGLYSAPTSITAQQTVTITATSQADSTKSGSAAIVLQPVQCSTNGYSYRRMIVIDHYKVPHTDQTNFPILFSSTDASFATTSNGGHVTSSSGSDIIFSTDPKGRTKLDHELEKYDPTTGQVIAWVRLPVLSHSSDTVLYMFYGNATVTTSQQNVAGVWDANYKGVWHLANGSVLSLADSTSNANAATNNGASATSGKIDGGMQTNGSSYATIGTPASLANLAQGNATFSAWVNTSSGAGRIMGKDDNNGSVGWALGLTSNNNVDFVVVYSGSDLRVDSSSPVSSGGWSYVTATLAGSATQSGQATIYINGSPSASGSGGGGQTGDDSAQTAYLANATYGDQATAPLNGSLDELRISNVIRSADWIATEYNNQSSPETFYALNAENNETVSPATVSLYASQSKMFVFGDECGLAPAVWSMPPDALGTLTATGLYTAPASIESLQTVTITASTLGDASRTSSATITLLPPVSVTVAPLSAILTSGQTQQFTSSVLNASNTSVNWTINPANVGTISASGLYTAPANVTTQQTVSVTATSQIDATASATATITLTPASYSPNPPSSTLCGSNGYSYQRAIVIDHTKVPNSDQTDFPFLFNTTDSDLATIANGGHVANSSGYDIIFSTDPNGGSKLDHELEQYNPVTGQVIAWVRVPTLSHSTDTVVYVFYGNSNIIASQQNPTGVWDSKYQAVYHLGSAGVVSAADSTIKVNNGTPTSVSAVAGEVSGAAGFSGSSSYVQIPSQDFPSYPTGVYNDLGLPQTSNTTSFTASFGVWFKTASPGGILAQVPSQFCDSYVFGFCIDYRNTVPGDYDPAGWNAMLIIDDNGFLVGGGVTTTSTYNDNNWHFAVVTYSTDGTGKLYVDGQNVGSAQQVIPVGYSPNYEYFVGTAYTLLTDDGNWDWLYFNGSIDEISVSNTARSSDWIKTEYNSQSSPATFYKFYPVGSAIVLPATASLYVSQAQQFAVAGMCNADVTWTMPSTAVGTLTPSGIYISPDNFTSQQSITITATGQSSGTTIGTATVTLLPPPSPITLAAAASSPYAIGTPQSFTATLKDEYGSPQVGVAVNFNVGGVNGNVGIGTTDSSGTASFSYKGSNSGTDTIQATAVVNGEPLTSSSLSVNWTVPPPPTTAEAVTLVPQPTVGLGGLVGAFTDNNGAVIQPIALGASAKTFLVPAGATQLQLGIDDDYFEDNSGTGFVVSVNGASIAVPPTTMPWNWVRGGLNNNYQYGLNDGASPIIAATGLTQGQSVSVAYQSGTVSAEFPLKTLNNADGDQSWITGTREWQGAYYPTLYTTASAYPIGQPITVTALVTDATGAPMLSVPVELDATGANPGQYLGTTTSSGVTPFVYNGSNAGTDILQAQATPTGQVSLVSNQSNVNWTNYPTPPAPGSLALTLFGYVNNVQNYIVLATDASGTPLPNVNVGMYVTGVDNIQFDGTTDETGHASFPYYHINQGIYHVLAVYSVNRNVVFSSTVTGNWTPGASTTTGGSNQINISISAQSAVTLPNTLQLNGTVTDNIGITPTVAWTQVSGPGTVTFADPQQAVTTASFSEPGDYVVKLSASDSGNSTSLQFAIKVNPVPVPKIQQGWVGSPLYGATVSGLVPITLAPGVNLQSGTLTYYPVDNPNNVTTLNSNTTGTGQIGLLDTTTLRNGTYWIQMQSTETNGNSEYDIVLVTVAGNYKPGRVTATVTDLVVPATGLSINIQRSYDSLNANKSGDFGYGWSLGTTVDLIVDPKDDVTFTLNGQRRTFYFAPHQIGFPFAEFVPAFRPEPGFYGTLTGSAPGCANDLDIMIINGGFWECAGGDQYNPPGYIYTDASGTKYTISAGGTLQSIVDRVGNALTITVSGITSTTGLSVPFVRDTLGRITQITDPQGNNYLYGYDSAGNLATVTCPNTTQASTYAYDTNHLYTGGTDARSNPLPTTAYFSATDTDPNGLPLNGRLHSVSDALGKTTSYAYDLIANTTTITYPADANGNVGTATMVYDNYGMLLSSTDPLGHTTTNVYDSNHNLASVTDSLGHTNTYSYDANGNKTSSVYPATSTTTNTTSRTAYNQYSEPTSTTDELGNVRTFNYDANFNPRNVTDGSGTLASFLFNADSTLAAGAIGYDITAQPAKASQFTYDTNGNLTSRTDALGRTTSYTYDSLGRKATMTVPLLTPGTSVAAATTTYTYDTLGNLTQTAAPLGKTTSSTYDANGNKTSDTDALGHVTSYQYDVLNRLITTTYPTSPATISTRTYDFRGHVVNETDQAGHVTHHEYDLAGRQTSVTTAYGTSSASTTVYTYYTDGKKATETDALNHTTSYTYDAAGNLTAIAGAKANIQYGYDNARNRISMTDANSHTTAYQFDARKRLVQTTYPDSTTTVNTYDGPGNLASVTDQAGHVVLYTYDAANQLQTVVQSNSPNTSNNTNVYGYDGVGNLAELADENGHTTLNAFDLLYRLTAKTLPDGSLTETRSYDTAGNLVSLTHFNGKTTTYAYDSLNRLLSRTPDPSLGESTVSFTYTATDKRATMTDGSGTTTYSYDDMDRLTTKAAPQGTLNYTYDAAGNLASMSSSHSNGVSVSYTYDAQNRLSTVVDGRLGSGANTTTYGYDPASNVANVTYPNGLQSVFSYDSLNRVTGLATQVSGYVYQLGPTGNRTSSLELNGRAINWTYDGINRLTQETVTSAPSGKNGTVSYGLDPVGNRLSDSSTLSGIPSTTESFDADDRLLTETYDSNGNTLTSGGKGFTYDSANHLTGMNGGAVTIVYDGDGNRVAKTVGGVTTQYLVDDLNPTVYAQVVEEVVSGAVTREYTYGLQRISQDQIISSTWAPSFYGYDGGGNVTALTNSAGSITDTNEYEAFGNLASFAGTTPNVYMYRGEQYDSDLGLYYLRARYMNPLTGRFMSRDPNEPQVRDANGTPLDPRKLHKYLYASGDPVNRIDPRGREDAEEEAGAGAEALDNLESIEKAQQRIRSGADGGKRIIDVIQKSLDRVGHLLDRITQGDYDPNDWE